MALIPEVAMTQATSQNMDQSATAASDSSAGQTVELHKCVRCGTEKPVEEVLIKHARKQPICKVCNTVTASLSRQGLVLGELLDPPGVICFLRSCQKSKAEQANSSLSFKTLRGLLHETMIERRTFSLRQESSGTFQPLSYYEHLGYGSELLDRIKAHAAREEHPILGTCYKVALTTVSEADVRESVEEQLFRKESAVKARRALPADATEEARTAKQAELTGLEDLSSDEDDKAGLRKAKRQKTNGKSAEKEAKKAAAKAKREEEQLAKKRAQLATKSVGGIKTMSEKLAKKTPVLDQITDELTKQGLRDTASTLEVWLKECMPYVTGKPGLHPLSFESAQQVQLKLKEANTLLFCYNGEVRAAKAAQPKAKAKAKSKPGKA